MPQLTTYTLAGRAVIAQATAPLLTHLAVGNGAVGAVAPDPLATTLVNEIGRVKYLERFFVTTDPGGAIIVGSTRYSVSATPTNLIYMRFRFLDAEAVGSWTEFGLFGNGVTFVPTALTSEEPYGVIGDDHVNTTDIVLSGAWALAQSGGVFVAVEVGGGSGVAQVSIVSSAPGFVGPGASFVPVTFGAALTLGNSGLAVTFTGGADHVLTAGDIFLFSGTLATARAAFAANGIYDALTNPTGQVLVNGSLFRLVHLSPAATKGAATVDVQLVVEVLNG